ncbi:MAG: ABC transporter substrate-binding protein [Lentisphaeria bacterium]|nr:ABC transporter substrate-binding protein [Lentisphaeria bacterium]
MKKILVLIFSFSALILTSCRIANQNDAFYSIRIGVILPLSGEFAAQGRAALDGMELAVRSVNRNGGVDLRKIQLIIKNSSGSPEKAAALAGSMIENDNVVALVGAYSSAEAAEIKLVAEAKGVPFVSAMATSGSLIENAEYTFQSTLNDEIQGAALAYYIAYKRKFYNVAVMINTDKDAVYQRGVAQKTAQAWADFAKRKPLVMSYSSKQKTFESQIKKCIYDDINVIVLPAYPATAVRFILEARKLGYKGAFAGTDSYDSPLLTGSNEALGDCFFSTSYCISDASEANKIFKSRMQQELKREPGCAEAMGYDCINFLAKALKNAYSPDDIAFNLRNIRSFYSVSGIMEYHKQKEFLLHPVFIMDIAGMNIKPYFRWKVDSEQLKNYRKREELK